MSLEISVVRTLDELAQVFSVRARVYCGEQRCPHDEEFDGNDFTATQILARSGGEPIGSLRIRYFGSFAKIERLAVLPAYRGTGTGLEIARLGIDLCRDKGFARLYAHVQKRLVPFWERLGFRPAGQNRTLCFSDHEYCEMLAEFEPLDTELNLHSDPMILLRPEGCWERPGVLDRSAARPATNPH
ncbi:MAG: GNAT family N-acetyltransferase [Rhizomicrobium sp.]